MGLSHGYVNRSLAALLPAVLALPLTAAEPPRPPRPLLISVHAAPSADPADPAVLIRYCLAPGQEPVWVRLPKGEDEISWFRGLSVRVDGLEPDYAVDLHPNDSPKRSLNVHLHAGECVTLKVRLRTIYLFPSDWQCITVRVSEGGGHEAAVAGNLILHRAEVAPAPETVRVLRLIRQLGSPRFAERKAAADGLNEIGDAALHHLRRAAAAEEDLEVRRRAAQLVNAIRGRRLERLRGS
jgi:hypothetical protein